MHWLALPCTALAALHNTTHAYTQTIYKYQFAAYCFWRLCRPHQEVLLHHSFRARGRSTVVEGLACQSMGVLPRVRDSLRLFQSRKKIEKSFLSFFRLHAGSHRSTECNGWMMCGEDYSTSGWSGPRTSEFMGWNVVFNQMSSMYCVQYEKYKPYWGW